MLIPLYKPESPPHYLTLMNSRTKGSAKGNNKEINAQTKRAMKLSSEEKTYMIHHVSKGTGIIGYMDHCSWCVV